MKSLLPIAVLIVFISCANKEKKPADIEQSSQVKENSEQLFTEKKSDGYNISGTIANAKSDTVILQRMVGANQYENLNTSTLDKKGEFTFKGEVTTPTYARIATPDGLAIPIVLENTNYSVKADVNSKEMPEVTGSEETDHYHTLISLFNRFTAKANAIKTEHGMTNEEQPPSRAYVSDMEGFRVESSKEFKSVIKSMGLSFVALNATADFMRSPAENMEFLKSQADTFATALDDHPYAEKFVEAVDKLQATTIGETAPDFTLPTPDGKDMKLSSLRGKYVLVDFWASWCRPCRAENPNVVKLYNKYKDEDFEILGVSLDKNKENWLRAIEQDGLTWKHVSDLKFWNSEVVPLYNIQGIPFTVLLDKEGKIIAKNLRGNSLENKLEELFGK